MRGGAETITRVINPNNYAQIVILQIALSSTKAYVASSSFPIHTWTHTSPNPLPSSLSLSYPAIAHLLQDALLLVTFEVLLLVFELLVHQLKFGGVDIGVEISAMLICLPRKHCTRHETTTREATLVSPLRQLNDKLLPLV